jgi:hypothetical protein
MADRTHAFARKERAGPTHISKFYFIALFIFERTGKFFFEQQYVPFLLAPNEGAGGSLKTIGLVVGD